ncbi:hypothetical protein [Psychroflexus montanilacus]|uniref:hypothetical protein n=1 Tax=Psychroflexus montanilacus TaxID=2873598 RepID=UPI001CCE6946|nr:hypothetical protein [Psychroflexus montanilacus]MBZ9652667.1 hypothetical protein [Psychroflexus montanilacus]
MSEKKELIEAFRKLDFKALNELLDDDISYMDVHKSLFLKRLGQEVNKYDKLDKYEDVTEGICGSCNRGCKAYSFSTKNCPSLNLFFEEKNDKVTDIYICNDLRNNISGEHEWNISLNFYEEEKVDFEPSLHYNINVQKAENCLQEFSALTSDGYVTSQDLVYWLNKHKDLISKLDLGLPFIGKSYQAFEKLDNLYTNVYALVYNHNHNSIATNALKEFDDINKGEEKSIVLWLLKHKNENFFSFKKTDNWQKTGLIIFDDESNVIIDCSDCLDSFLYEDLYSNLENSLLIKYEPTDEHYLQNGGSVNYSLETFLRFHNKYLDIL